MLRTCSIVTHSQVRYTQYIDAVRIFYIKTCGFLYTFVFCQLERKATDIPKSFTLPKNGGVNQQFATQLSQWKSLHNCCHVLSLVSGTFIVRLFSNR